jgi:rhodanese-related sulfurtransferase
MSGIEQLLLRTRARIDRLGPLETAEALAAGDARLVDIRPAAQRAAEGEFADSLDVLVIERNVLEWRLDPASDARIPEATGPGVRWIVACQEGYASSLAAAALRDIGLHRAADLDGGFRAWREAGLPAAGQAGRSGG